jgi:hypothetical protein
VDVAAEQMLDALFPDDPAVRSGRAEVGYRVRDVWVTGGALYRDSATLVAAPVLNLQSGPVGAPAALGFTLTADGRVWKSIYGSVYGIRWQDDDAPYQARYQTRTEVAFRSTFPNKFPRGNFGLQWSVVHEYRSRVEFPAFEATISDGDWRTWSTLLQIRLNTALLTYQFRNLRGLPYHQVPGYRAPRQTQFYGIRWEFWN